MPATALVTGASSGIGKEFARLHARKGGDLVLTARREDALSALKEELEAAEGVTVHVFPADLAAPGAAEALYEDVKKAGIEVGILINNAGFGGHGIHVERDLQKELQMIDLNVKALVVLTHAFAGDMAARGSGKILNVSSTAGFLPGPLQAVYFATKAFVTSYSQAVDHELRDKGVTCTALAPGYVATEFAETADLTGTRLVSSGGASPASVARHGYEAMRAGQLVTVNEPVLGFLLNWVFPFLPRRFVMSQMERMQSRP